MGRTKSSKWPAPARIRGGEGMGRKEGRDGPKWPASAKITGDRVQGWKMEEGGTNERAETDKWGEKKAETDLNGRPLPN